MKDAIARAGERLGPLKLNGRLRTRSPLSDVVELETLVVGIAGKRRSGRAYEAQPRFRPKSSTTSSIVPKVRSQSSNERGKPLSAERSISTTVPRPRPRPARTLLQRGALSLWSALTIGCARVPRLRCSLRSRWPQRERRRQRDGQGSGGVSWVRLRSSRTSLCVPTLTRHAMAGRAARTAGDHR